MTLADPGDAVHEDATAGRDGLRLAVVLPVARSQVVLDKMRADYDGARLGVHADFLFADGAPEAIESPADVRAAEQGVVHGVRAAARAGAHAVLVACFSDPGVDAAGRAVEIPVVGEGAPTVAAVGALFDSFSILSASSSTIEAKTRQVAELGLASRLRAVVGIDVPVAELTIERAGHVAELVAVEARAGARAVVLGCTGLQPGFTSAVRAALPPDVHPEVVVDPCDVAGRMAVALAASARRGAA